MHSTDTGELIFHHDGDFSGVIGFGRDDKEYATTFADLAGAQRGAEAGATVLVRVKEVQGPWGQAVDSAPVPVFVDSIRSLLAERVRREHIARLENMDIAGLLTVGAADVESWSREER